MPSTAKSKRPNARKRPPGAPPPRTQLQGIRALVLDCDGVLTPGGIFYSEEGHRLLRFHARDGVGIAFLARYTDVQLAILSGRPTDVAEQRHRELGVSYFVGPCRDKFRGLLDLCATMDVAPEACAFMGDDLPDLRAFAACGLPIAVGDASPEVAKAARWVTKAPGGHGAVREVAEAILKARGEWQRWFAKLQDLDKTDRA